jgi:hypothetical protein
MKWTLAILRIEREIKDRSAGVLGRAVQQLGQGDARERALAGLSDN